MGDRGNIVVRQQTKSNKDDVWLYTHWSGSEIPGILRKALAREQRWDDPSYLTRIIFCEMVGDEVKNETGFGIGCRLPDNEHDVLVLDCDRKSVFQVPESAITEEGRVQVEIEEFKHWPFSEFAVLKDSELPKI